MTSDAQRDQVDGNFNAFELMLPTIIGAHRNQHALMRDRQIVRFFTSPGDAYRAGLALYPDQVFSIQEVTDESIDLGFWSHVGGR